MVVLKTFHKEDYMQVLDCFGVGSEMLMDMFIEFVAEPPRLLKSNSCQLAE